MISRGDPMKCRINSAKIGMPFNNNCKMAVVRVISDLEVDDESSTPFKTMRYPIENAGKHQELLAQRTAWFRKELQFDESKASQWATQEFTAFYGTQDELVDSSDPGLTIKGPVFIFSFINYVSK